MKPDSENVHRLCQALLEDSKPIPALMIAERFQQANMAGNGMKGQAEEGKKLQATIKLIREQIDKLNVDFLKNQALAKRGNLSASIEMAVILYRSGFNRKAIQLLNRELDGKEKHIGCIRTKQAFFLENRLNTQAFLILKKDFNRSLQNRDSKNALKKCAQLCYLAIYGEKPLDELSLYNEFFPGVIDRHMLSLFVNICNYHKQIDRFFRSLN
ncbi:MAG: hypothetical protein CR997_07905 [Acidobacteria bacterium]|nr:MAG: hypothetical protein CR997_07905 [Acidobacteriota bacterium]